jgi:hypothetical protein
MDTEKQQKNIDKGNEGEKLFAEYLDSQNIPFYRVDQKRETYSVELSAKRIRRPDFIIHTKNGLFHVDVKYHKKYDFGKDGEKRFYLKQEDIERLFNLQSELNSHVWLAFVDNDSLKTPIFFYAPMSDIYAYYTTVFTTYKKNYPEEYNRVSEVCFVYIPEKLLYDRLSLEKGFYKEPDVKFLEEEAECYKNKAAAIENPNKIKQANLQKSHTTKQGEPK